MAASAWNGVMSKYPASSTELAPGAGLAEISLKLKAK